MKMKKIITAASLAGFVAMPGSALGQAATSDVVGYYTQTLNPGFNILGVALHSAPVATGTFESDLTDTDGPDFTTVLTDTNATYLLEVETGPQAGAVAEITAQTATTLTVDGGLPTGGADYTIRTALTLNELFPDGTLRSGFGAADSDVVFLPDGTGGFDQFFFSSIGTEFRSVTDAFNSPPRPISVFYPDALFVQITDTARTVVIAGDLKSTGTVVAAESGFNLVASPGPVGTTLGNSNLSASLDSGFGAADSDVVFLPNGPGGTFTQYFFSSLAPGSWRLATDAFGASQDDVELTSGFFIQRNDVSTAVIAAVPDFYAGL